MASTLTTESRSSLRDKRNAVPLLLSSFPAPPSHIPSSPFTPLGTPLSAPLGTPLSALFGSPLSAPHSASALGPPPTLPPSSPLPPVPGPSPISDHDTLLFITAARSRRASKLSVTSSSGYSRRNSTATLASNASSAAPSLSSSAGATPADSSLRSLRSYPSNGSLSAYARHADKSPMFEPRICEEDPAELTRLSLDEIPAPSPAPDLSDDEKVLELGLPPSLTRRARHSANDSISSIDMRDLPPLHEDEIDAPVSAPPVLRSHSSHASDLYASARKPTSINKALPPLPPDSRTPDEPATFPRSDSPDIKTILATTPRPHRKSSTSCLSGRSRSPSRSRSQPRRAPLRRHVSEGLPSARRREGELRRTSEASLPVPARGGRPESPTGLAYARNAWVEDSFVSDYGVLLDGTGTPMDVVDGEEARLERELDGSGSDTDSSIDIHTPLPNLMLRHGLLSPNSKLLPQASRVGTPSLSNGRPGSLLSVASKVDSVMTKSGLYKDGRDTAKRRHRHRDGKLLRGGIGLTTGLGWSDSEDEDAPSPLTHKLSANTLKRKSTPSAFRSPHPLSRIGSATGLSALAKDGRPRELSRSPCPQDRRVSSSSAASSTAGVPSRTSVSSLRSTSSAGRLAAGTLGYIHEREETLESTSSTSSASVSMPVTPVGYDGPGLSPILGSRNGRTMQRPKLDAGLAFMGRSVSGGSNLAATPSSLPSARTPSVPRPLKLPQVHAQSGIRHARDGAYQPTLSASSMSSIGSMKSLERPRVSGELQRLSRSVLSGVPRSGVPSTTHSTPAPRSVSMTAHTPTRQPVRTTSLPQRGAPAPSPEIKQKPRTGTGMVYRSSSASAPAPRASMMRMPSSSRLRAAANLNAEVGIAL
ncbi:hypothetical protein POSPLADRAFT_1036279 [Postia placenta MAD-698-R-SB12]|uniref:Uncharacterized protein n=1 Tax=Postia placenta MAD-698-R-SB12 TaxID=670580 RepID=A0A1X6MNX9_9APHY|nr:hypothetical protein POSPLADRAFT_1036279 [Postia placenta MAD-698-R-SB12]OSX58117.1 hypothetical protein POSPLADRAFT_1036279 [Postia placenta MAD-698-R-SB12]